MHLSTLYTYFRCKTGSYFCVNSNPGRYPCANNNISFIDFIRQNKNVKTFRIFIFIFFNDCFIQPKQNSRWNLISFFVIFYLSNINPNGLRDFRTQLPFKSWSGSGNSETVCRLSRPSKCPCSDRLGDRPLRTSLK